jgi:hypothetical protein
MVLPAAAQKQLILLRNERVLLRLRPGDEFIFRLKNSKTIRRTYINNVFETSVVTHRDTVAFHNIDRVYFGQSKFYNRLGAAMVVGGGALFLIDQLNMVVVQGNEPSLDHGISTVSAAAVVIGLPMALIHKKSQRLNYKYRLLMAKKGSVFFQSDPREPINPFLEN